MIAQIPPEIAGLFTEKNLVYATAAWLLAQNIGRAYQAIKAEKGLRGMWQALMFGTNTPTEKQQQQTKKEQ